MQPCTVCPRLPLPQHGEGGFGREHRARMSEKGARALNRVVMTGDRKGPSVCASAGSAVALKGGSKPTKASLGSRSRASCRSIMVESPPLHIITVDTISSGAHAWCCDRDAMARWDSSGAPHTKGSCAGCRVQQGAAQEALPEAGGRGKAADHSRALGHAGASCTARAIRPGGAQGAPQRRPGRTFGPAVAVPCGR